MRNQIPPETKYKIKKETGYWIKDGGFNAGMLTIVNQTGCTVCYFLMTNEGPLVTKIVGCLNVEELEAIYTAFRICEKV